MTLLALLPECNALSALARGASCQGVCSGAGSDSCVGIDRVLVFIEDRVDMNTKTASPKAAFDEDTMQIGRRFDTAFSACEGIARRRQANPNVRGKCSR